MGSFRNAPFLGAVHVRSRGFRKAALQGLARARAEGGVFIRYVGQGGPELATRALLYFGKALTEKQKRSLRRAGFTFDNGGWLGWASMIPRWAREKKL